MSFNAAEQSMVIAAERLRDAGPRSRDIYRLRCRTCPGAAAFDAFDPRTACPVCGGPTGPASKTPPAPATEVTPSPLADDPVIAKLQERQREIPARIRELDERLASLRAQRTATAKRLAEVRVLASAGVAKDRDVSRVEAELADIDNELVFAEDDAAAITSTMRVVAEEIVRQTDARRAALAPKAIAAAEKFSAAMSHHLDAIDKLIADAEREGDAFERALATRVAGQATYPSERCGRAVSVLRFFSKPQRRTGRPIAAAFERFRRLAEKLRS